MKNTIIIGIDLSFNSTGITISTFNDKIAKTIEFHRLVFDDQKTIKTFIPKQIINVNQYTYKLPTNISVSDIIVDSDDYNTLIQAEATIKSMICVKRLMNIIERKISKINSETQKLDVIINIEGFLMPQVQGEQQFKSLTGLIMLQGLLRSDLIKIKISNRYNIDNLKIYITTPKELKKWFTGNGNADKQLMLDAFFKYYNGDKLLSKNVELAKINDVIDSFALMMNGYGKLIGFLKPKKKIKKIRKKKFKNSDFSKIDILKDSIPN